MTTPTTAVFVPAEDAARKILFARSRPPRPGALSASLTFGWRGLLKIKHVPEQLFDVIAIPTIFTLLFTYLFGGALAGSPGVYIQSLLPGTLAMAVLLVTMYAGIGLITDISTGAFDRFRTAPIWRPAHIVGALLGDIGRYLLASSLVLALGLVLGFRPAGGVIGVLVAVGLVVVFALGLSWIWIVLGLILRTPTAVYSVTTVILFPLTMASNTFVDPRTMPGWLQAFVGINPITHLVTAARGLMAGTATGGEVTWVLVAAAALAIVFAPIAMWLYRNKN